MFEPISLETWPRRPYFEQYTRETPCTYSICRELDVGNLRARGLHLQPAMLYLLTEQVNRRPQFRTSTDRRGRLGIYREMHPCYTVFHRETETFSNLWTAFDRSYGVFYRRYREDQRRYGGCPGLYPKPDLPENTFSVSTLPWTTFSAFHLQLDKGSGYFLPIFTLGRCTEQAGRWTLPLAMQVHHAVCDGYHAAVFLEDLQAAIAAFAPEEEACEQTTF